MPPLRDVPSVSTADISTAACFDILPPDYWFGRVVNMRGRDRRAPDMVNGKIVGGTYGGFHHMLDCQEAASAIYLCSVKMSKGYFCTGNRKPNTVPRAEVFYTFAITTS
eukprot:gnl/TRDRNA2_/TRDRNA2_173837_c0_seq5.p1 gnl/TRDRNA2_/TRDRNA2_173837_c0~~gnl/TRDRNA2_/TRDRNA2_173837_c0_seq5.p1  ORF type:complete len:109 (-),score=13.37 gnl/TRDRNA2_/TRDRNA2_173837_c0_seq5:113-439(-)